MAPQAEHPRASCDLRRGTRAGSCRVHGRRGRWRVRRRVPAARRDRLRGAAARGDPLRSRGPPRREPGDVRARRDLAPVRGPGARSRAAKSGPRARARAAPGRLRVPRPPAQRARPNRGRCVRRLARVALRGVARRDPGAARHAGPRGARRALDRPYLRHARRRRRIREPLRPGQPDARRPARRVGAVRARGPRARPRAARRAAPTLTPPFARRGG